MQRGPAGPALDVKSGLSLEVVTGKAHLKDLKEMPHFVDISLCFVQSKMPKARKAPKATGFGCSDLAGERDCPQDHRC